MHALVGHIKLSTTCGISAVQFSIAKVLKSIFAGCLSRYRC